jgi:carboxypeptidase A4
VGYIDVHSYSQLILTPYGYTCDDLPDDNDQMQRVAAGMSEAIKNVYGTVFTFGPACRTIYRSSGGGVDYSKDVAGVKYPLTIELRDKGEKGFVLPPEDIKPSGEEFWAGFIAYVEHLRE